MKSFVLCCVLIYLSASDADNTSSSSSTEGLECLGLYLKSKGKIEFQSSGSKKGSLCADNLPLAMRAYRDEFESKLRKDHPNETACVMEQFDKNEVMDVIMMKVYNDELKATKGEDNDTSKSSDEVVNNDDIGTKCGLDVEKIEKIMTSVFTTSSEETM